ncbi:MAG: tRNA uridine-5-carboxymethylaminomethyl(34) synthesis GTPase MnmE [Kiritimatiellae bacterium]|nr:tRNA uridine-5-carboxymethylaminomethyl(34) synthesis GTPase MnmE [Kiritimatiellia bacterium]
MRNDSDPIAALATAAGPAGISVVRISGNGALSIGDALLPPGTQSVSSRPHGTFFHTHILHPRTGETVDDAVVLVFRAPHSYTGEDTVEVQGHGGGLPSRRLLDAALAAGARLAEPGEYTLRAFLNGKMDLTQAEAVADFISAKSEVAAQVARSQLDGALGSFLSNEYNELVAIGADVEHVLDFSEDELPPDLLQTLQERLMRVTAILRDKLSTWREGRVIAEGALVVISGKPNAGKSSLLNALLGERRAIVSAISGTTRDAIEEGMVIRGVAVRLVDTAGIRTGVDEIEEEGIERAKSYLARADLVLRLVDPMAKTVSESEGCEDLISAKSVLILTKQDLWQETFSFPGALAISTKTGYGLEELRQEIVRRLGIDKERFDQPLVSLRQRQELECALLASEQALDALREGAESLVIAGLRLRTATEAIGRILGKVYTADLLDAVFSRFCVGK